MPTDRCSSDRHPLRVVARGRSGPGLRPDYQPETEIVKHRANVIDRQGALSLQHQVWAAVAGNLLDRWTRGSL